MAKDYLSKYAIKNDGIQKFQEGGAMMPAEGGAPEAAPQQGGGDLQSMLGQFAQSQDPQLAVMICNALIEQMGAQQEAPAPAMEKGGRMSYNAPMFKKGGKL